MASSDDYFELLFELSPDVIYSISAADGSLLRLNPAFERITGYKIKDWLGRNFIEIVHPEDVPVARKRFALHLQGGDTSQPFILRVKAANGKYLIGEFSSVSLKHDGEVKEIIGVVRDITDRVEAGKKIERATALLQDLLRQSHSG